MADRDASAVRRSDDAVFNCLIRIIERWMDVPENRREFERWKEEQE